MAWFEGELKGRSVKLRMTGKTRGSGMLLTLAAPQRPPRRPACRAWPAGGVLCLAGLTGRSSLGSRCAQSCRPPASRASSPRCTTWGRRRLRGCRREGGFEEGDGRGWAFGGPPRLPAQSMTRCMAGAPHGWQPPGFRSNSQAASLTNAVVVLMVHLCGVEAQLVAVQHPHRVELQTRGWCGVVWCVRRWRA